MGRPIASDALAGHHAPAGTLMFREQFTSASTTSQLVACWMIPFEHAQPIRSPAAFKGQRNFAGLWWCITNQRHIGFESWCERDNLMSFDFDPNVTGISSQPFRITWTTPLPQYSHVPDFFIRHADGTAVVIVVCHDERVKPVDEEIFQATMRLCSTVGWDYQTPRSLACHLCRELALAVRLPAPSVCSRTITDPVGGCSRFGRTSNDWKPREHCRPPDHRAADPIPPVVESQDSGRPLGTPAVLRNTADVGGLSMTDRHELLRIGDDVEFHGTRYQLAAFVGDIALLAVGGEAPVAIKVSTLFADKSFKALIIAPLRRRIAGPSPLFEALPREVQQKARWLEAHVTEVLDGVPCNAGPTHVPQRIYNPQLTSLRQRDLAKIAEINTQGARFSLSKFERHRRAYERQGILGLVDQRLIRRDPVAGKTDQLVVEPW